LLIVAGEIRKPLGPPVTLSQFKKIQRNTSAKENVTMARYMSRILIEGIAIKNPTTAATIPPARTENRKGIGIFVLRRPYV
jgi:hypothetical protein